MLDCLVIILDFIFLEGLIDILLKLDSFLKRGLDYTCIYLVLFRSILGEINFCENNYRLVLFFGVHFYF